MAKKNFRGYLQGDEVRYKKYLYVLRPPLAARWLYEGRGMPPMRFAELAEATLDDGALFDEINRLLAVKMRRGESAISPRWPRIHEFIKGELDAAANCGIAETRPADDGALDAFLAETILKSESLTRLTQKGLGKTF
jgi:predicted nucleotidyltransferase